MEDARRPMPRMPVQIQPAASRGVSVPETDSQTAPAHARTILFLQGLASPFFWQLGRTLARQGHRVHRINVCFGDRLFWWLPAANYRGTLSGWRKYLTEYLAEHRITDVVLFGDCRPYHRIAISLASHSRVQVHVFEEGYLRPYWITVERGGVNGHSSLPRDPGDIMELAAGLDFTTETPFPGSFPRRAVWDVIYNVGNVLGRVLYPGYRRHRPNHIFVEYLGWLRRALGKRRAERIADREVRRAVALPEGFYLLPLQLDSDYQIRVHSRFGVLGEFLDDVMASFARHGPPGSELLVKVHPLDPGLIDRRRQVGEIAVRHGLGGRVRTIEAGHLPTLLDATLGVVVVNSTVGTSAIEHRRPTIALGTAIYDIPGLTFQGGLDRFWREADAPDPALFLAFRKLIIDRTQVNGGYFCKAGMALAIEASAARVLAGEAPQPMYGPAPAAIARAVLPGASAVPAE